MVFLALALRARGAAGYGRGKLGPSWPSPFGRAAFVGTWLLRSCSKLGLAPTVLSSVLCRVKPKLDQALIDDAFVLGLQEGSTWTLMKDVGTLPPCQKTQKRC